MGWTLLGIFLGIIIGINSGYSIPIEYIKYTAVIIVGILDSLFGAIKADISGRLEKEKYNPTIFITGLTTNILLALSITLLGEYMGLELYLAATVVFTFRIFNNIAKIRRILIKKWTKEGKESKA